MMWRLVMCAVLVLGGCVGGDKDAVMSAVGDPPTEEDRERIETLASEYRAHPAFARQWALGRIGADVAYARLAIEHGEDVRPGAGVTVGVYDTGIDQDHPAFEETRIDEVFLPGTFDETGVIPSHGTAVASVIAGTPATSLADGAQGVAWGADVMVLALHSGPPDFEPPEFEMPQTEWFPPPLDILPLYDDANAEEYRAILAWRDGERRVEFLNLSVGSQGLIEDYTETELRSVMAQTIAAIAQEGVDEKTIFVWAAGNDNGIRCLPASHPVWMAGWWRRRQAWTRVSRRISPSFGATRLR